MLKKSNILFRKNFRKTIFEHFTEQKISAKLVFLDISTKTPIPQNFLERKTIAMDFIPYKINVALSFSSTNSIKRERNLQFRPRFIRSDNKNKKYYFVFSNNSTAFLHISCKSL